MGTSSRLQLVGQSTRDDLADLGGHLRVGVANTMVSGREGG
ncbi:hypothetical protein [Nocardiopsis alba]